MKTLSPKISFVIFAFFAAIIFSKVKLETLSPIISFVFFVAALLSYVFPKPGQMDMELT